VAQSGSPAQDSQGGKVVKYWWQPRNGCDGWITTIQVKFVTISSEGKMRQLKLT